MKIKNETTGTIDVVVTPEWLDEDYEYKHVGNHESFEERRSYQGEGFCLRDEVEVHINHNPADKICGEIIWIDHYSEVLGINPPCGNEVTVSMDDVVMHEPYSAQMPFNGVEVKPGDIVVTSNDTTGIVFGCIPSAGELIIGANGAQCVTVNYVDVVYAQRYIGGGIIKEVYWDEDADFKHIAEVLNIEID